VTLRSNPQKQAIDAKNRIFSETMERTGGDVEAATKAVREYTRQISGGTQQGTLDVKRSPEYLQNQTDQKVAQQAGESLPPAIQTQVSALDNLSTTIGDIAKNFDEQFLGPVKGMDAAFNARRTAGGLIGNPLTKQEVVFRQAIKDANDQLLRARSGAAITESEYSRLAGMLPKATDEPGVFQASLERFRNQTKTLRDAKINLGTTPRNQLGGSQPAPSSTGNNPAPSQRAPGATVEQRTVIDGKPYIKVNGKWYLENG
jgi:hypothetical protein